MAIIPYTPDGRHVNYYHPDIIGEKPSTLWDERAGMDLQIVMEFRGDGCVTWRAVHPDERN
jgi:hypothetical protein